MKRGTRHRCKASSGSALQHSIVVLEGIPRAVDAKPTTIRAQLMRCWGFIFRLHMVT